MTGVALTRRIMRVCAEFMLSRIAVLHELLFCTNCCFVSHSFIL